MWFIFALSLLLAAAAVRAESTLDYGTDVSYPMHYSTITHTSERDILGANSGDEHQRTYDENLAGCIEFYTAQGHNGSRMCHNSERDRIAMNLRKPASMINYTATGFQKIRAPKEVWKLVQDFWNENKDKFVEENYPTGDIHVNYWKARPSFVGIDNTSLPGGGSILRKHVWEAARSTLSEWTGMHLADCSLYGIRIYHDGAILAPHVDRFPLISSAILNVAQDVDEPWPLEVIGHDGRAHNVTMQPGDLVLYESHSIIHGRPYPLKGKYMANIFMHFEPVAPLSEPNPKWGGDFPPYVIPDSAEAKVWKSLYPDGWKPTSQQALTNGTTELHQLVNGAKLAPGPEAYNQVKNYLKHHPQDINKADAVGWTPLHEAARAIRLDILNYLVMQGANIHAINSQGQSVLRLLYDSLLQDPAFASNPQDHPSVQFLENAGATCIPAPCPRGQARRNVRATNNRQARPDTTEGHTNVNLLQLGNDGDREDMQKVIDYVKAHPDHLELRDALGWTMLHEAVRSKRMDAVTFLVNMGADINALTDSGDSVLRVAYYFVGQDPNYASNPQSHPVIQYLEGMGAKMLSAGGAEL